MMRRVLLAIVIAGIVGAGAFWLLTMPDPLKPASVAQALAAHSGDVQNGERVFNMGGCASCHAAKGAKDADRLKLLGGQALVTPFGTFYVPNISPDPTTGIGTWPIADVLNAVLRGVAPDGAHYYPAFPYDSYTRMTVTDAIDLAAYLKTLPPMVNKVPGHELKFPFTIRRAIGLWKLLYLKVGPIVALAHPDEAQKRGQYIVEGAGHCGECHTPRNIIGGPDLSRWLAGAPLLEGSGRSPDITPDTRAIGGWSAPDISYYLEAGLTPDGDSVGGAMTEVVANLARLPKSDRDAIAAYLKAVPPLPPAPKPVP